MSEELIQMPNGLYARPNTSDEGTWHDVFNLRRGWHRPPKGFIPRMIFDIGAYVGYTTWDYWVRYPAQVFAAELDMGNFRMLEKNLESVHTGLVARPIAVGAVPGGGVITGEAYNARKFEYNLTATMVQVETLDTLYGEAYVDFLKLDIEGMEQEILERGGGWANRTRCINVEVHDEYKPEDGIRDLEKMGFKVTQSETLPWNLTGFKP